MKLPSLFRHLSTRPRLTSNLTPRNHDLLETYYSDRALHDSHESCARGDKQDIASLYKLMPNPMRQGWPDTWMFDVMQAGESFLRFVGRRRGDFNVYNCDLGGAEFYWRDDLVHAAETRTPVSSRFAISSKDQSVVIEHLALPIVSNRIVREIVGAFDFADGKTLSERSIVWSEVSSVQRQYGPVALGWRRTGARLKPPKKEGAFNASIDSALPGNRVHWLQYPDGKNTGTTGNC